jgi:hypothetical protein
MPEFRRVQYVREEYQEGGPYEGSLLTFLFDIPYFPPYGIFPPFHLLNQFLATGGSQGGMGPGATWEPFSITEQEYAGLVEAIQSTPLDEIKAHARYAWLKPILDPSLDHVELYLVWMLAAGQKHRARYQEAMRALREKKGSR